MRGAAAFAALAALSLAASGAVVEPTAPVLAQPPDLEGYVLVDQWPDRGALGPGVLERPTGMDVAADGRIYIADAGTGGVHVMLPSGLFLPPFGGSGVGPERLGVPGRLAVQQDDERV